jgi:nitrogen fixation/metabolism regulation signal transduction histidine kinase
MESLGLTKELVGLVSAIGIVPTILICGVVLFFIIRELKKEHHQTIDSISSLKKHSDEADKKLDDKINNVVKDIKYMQSESMTKEDHYRDVEGWKSSIDTLTQTVANMPLEILKVIQNFKESK